MNKKIGILGGGQLAMMMIESARKIGITSINVLDPNKNCPAGSIGAGICCIIIFFFCIFIKHFANSFYLNR